MRPYLCTLMPLLPLADSSPFLSLMLSQVCGCRRPTRTSSARRTWLASSSAVSRSPFTPVRFLSLSLSHQASLPLRSCTHTTLLLQASYFARPTPTHEPGAPAPLLLLPQLLGADLAPAPACSLVYGYMNRTYIYGLDCWTSASSLSLPSLLASKTLSMTDGPGPGCSS